MQDPFCTFHNRTDPSKDAVANIRCFVGFADPGPVGLLRAQKEGQWIRKMLGFHQLVDRLCRTISRCKFLADGF